MQLRRTSSSTREFGHDDSAIQRDGRQPGVRAANRHDAWGSDVKILAVGDMHLGRTPSRLPHALPARDLGPAEAWRRTVAAAVDEGVTAVLLAGDVVDRDDDFFEAYRALESGVSTLAGAGIEVIGVAGNHDVKVLPRLVRHIPQFRLLGEGGDWESCRIEEGRDSVTLWGWSFPQARVLSSPLADHAPQPAPGINLGLLHCDRDAGPSSPYAPTSRLELARAGLDGWLLGHIHQPDALTAASPNGYLGSLTGMDRSESGARGPWLISVRDGRIAGVEHMFLAPLRWEALEVDLEGIGDPFQARERLLAAVTALDARIASLPSPPNAVGLSICLSGRTGFGNAALDQLSPEDRNETHTGATGTQYFIVNVHLDTRPEIDLEDLARRPDPIGLLATRLLWLERPVGDPERDHLVDQARRSLREQCAQAVWRGLGSGDDTADPVTWLRHAGIRALDHLQDQVPDRRDAD